MARYRKKPVVIEAEQWFCLADQPGYVTRWSPHDVALCKHCGGYLKEHGQVLTLEGSHIVCPGDWIITGVVGEHYPCKPDIFEQTYEAVVEDT